MFSWHLDRPCLLHFVLLVLWHLAQTLGLRGKPSLTTDQKEYNADNQRKTSDSANDSAYDCTGITVVTRRW
jgi:hypothetical protein